MMGPGDAYPDADHEAAHPATTSPDAIQSVGVLDGYVASHVSALPDPIIEFARTNAPMSQPTLIVPILTIALVFSAAAHRWASTSSLRRMGRLGARSCASAVAASLLTLIVCFGLKTLIGRARPYAIAPSDPFLYNSGSQAEAFQSMPSAQAAVAGALAISMLLSASRTGLIWIPFAIWAASSRILLADHWLSDVILGLGLGAVMALITDAIGNHLYKAVPEPSP